MKHAEKAPLVAAQRKSLSAKPGAARRAKKLVHGSGYNKLIVMKHAARSASVSANEFIQPDGSHQSFGFVPAGAEVRVVQWPKL